MVVVMKKKLFIIFISVIFLLSILSFSFFPIFKAKLNGDNVTIEVFNNYIDEGIDTCYGLRLLGCKYKPQIEVINNVDINKLGDYEIVYKINYFNQEKILKRNVKVIDTTPPVITTDKEEITTCPNNLEYDLNYQAIDNYDQDITSNVKKEVKDNKLNLYVSDSSNNLTTKEIPIKYQDEEKPVITLKGNKTIYLTLGSNYQEPGYSVSDNCSKDLTNKVQVTNNIDKEKVGTYYVTYTVTDDANNKTTIKRTIKVITNTPSNSSNNSGKKIIYLTFDDGPSIYTDHLLDILKEYNVKATFFVTWQHPAYASAIKRAYQEGHAIGLHTYSHVYRNVYQSVDSYFNDLDAISNEVKNLIGIESKLIRFPGGSSNTVSRITPKIMTTLTKEVETRGYRYFDWNISSNDTQTNNSSTIASNVIKYLKNGTYIVLQHDTKKGSVEAVKQIIEYGLTHNYTFLPLDMNSPTAHHKINN